MEFLIGFILSSIVAIIAYLKKSLSFDGAFMAIALGSVIYFCGGIIPYNVMIIFFISSSLISKLKVKLRKDNLENINEKGNRRDYKQVLANGGVAFVTIILYKITGNYDFFIATIISFASSTADTWGSEVGKLFNGKVISIINFKEIQKGISGGISLIGTIASGLGALTIAIAFYILGGKVELIYVFIVFALGFLGSIIDSILGASLQGKYIDSTNKSITEKRISVNKKKNKLVQGFSFINNDTVNILSNILTTSISILILSR